jgi:Mn-dependent DtxR family transcriptional regulator
MRVDTRNVQEVYEYVALNWGKLSVGTLSRQLKVSESYLHKMVLRMRRRGVRIPKLEGAVEKRQGYRSIGVDYNKIAKLIN